MCELCASHRARPISASAGAFSRSQVSYANRDKYDLSNLESDEDARALAEEAINLLLSGNVIAETLHLQSDFDAAYFKQHAALEAQRAARSAKLEQLIEQICSVTPAEASSYKGLTALHGSILRFIKAHTGTAAAWGATGDAATEAEAAIHAEIVAALESVFPRVGFPAFVAMSDADKSSQLHELAHLILGIRLFNWDVGKGGAGIVNVPGAALEAILSTCNELDASLAAANDACGMYAGALQAAASGEAAGHPLASPQDRSDWFTQLVNRRQVCAYMGALLDEAGSLRDSVQEAIAAFQNALDATKRMVMGKGSVPKQAVYPHFHRLAELWLETDNARETLQARDGARAVLNAYSSPECCTLELATARALRQEAESLPEQPFTLVDEGAAGASGATTDVTAEVLALEDAAEFMQLPLELQGYCPVSLVGTGVDTDGFLVAANQGALVPGDPAQGVIKVGERYVVCATAAAAQAFTGAPLAYLSAAVEAAAACPALIHLLQVSSHMPLADLGALIQGGEASAGALGGGETGSAEAAATGGGGGSGKVDAGVQTPVHFVESNIEPGYTWNEWTLRQRALRLANLRKAATSSTQTNESHFKRDSSAQVYLPRESETQTATHRGTNPIKTVRYVTGLRGFAPAVRPPRPSESKEAQEEKRAGNAAATATRAKVVNLSFDLTELR